MNTGQTATGIWVWMVNGVTDRTSDASENSGVYSLSVSKADQSIAGIHHLYRQTDDSKGALTRVIVRGKLKLIVLQLSFCNYIFV